MNHLESIDIEVISTQENTYSPQLIAILNELRDLLQDYRENGTQGSIDLRSLPMLPGDYETLKSTLGQGEVNVMINALGPSEIRETAIPGIWWITHKNTEGDTLTEFLEVTSIPDLVKTPQEDLMTSVDKLEQLITDLAVPEYSSKQ